MKASYYLINGSKYAVQIQGIGKLLFVSTMSHPKDLYGEAELDKVVAIWKRSAIQNKKIICL